MRAGSKASLEAAMERWNATLGTVDDLDVLTAQLTAVVDVLEASAATRRSLTDPARSGDDKARLVETLFSGRVASPVVDLMAGMARSRWSSADDLPDALERLAWETALAQAERSRVLEQVIDELFQVHRLLGQERELREHLTAAEMPLANRLGLLDAVLGHRLNPNTLQMLRRLVSSQRRSLASAIRELAHYGVERRDRMVATVTAAVPLSDAQIERLTRILEDRYQRKVHVNVAVDPEVIGGVRVQIGDDLVDSTIATKLENVRRQIAG